MQGYTGSVVELPSSVSDFNNPFPLLPIQQGMLFHHLREEHSGVDIEQLVIELSEEVDSLAMEIAWQNAIERHPVLRTSFAWESRHEPVQVIHSRLPFFLGCEDWTALTTEMQGEKIAEFLLEDRLRGFDLRVPPLMRVNLIGLAPQHCRLIWTFHHILLDGRSFSTILREVFAMYEDPSLELPPPPPPHTTFTEWSHGLDHTGDEQFWRGKLKGFQAPTQMYGEPLSHLELRTKTARYGESELIIPAATSDRLRHFAERESVTVNTLVMAAWAILLMRYSGQDDVVFDTTKTARHSGLDRADDMVGLFMNTLPMRVTASGELKLCEFLRVVRAGWLSLREHEFTPLADIRRASEVPASQPLSESLVVFENLRFSTELRTLGGSWSEREFRLLEQTNYAITLAAYNDPAIVLKIEFDSTRFTRTTIERTLAHLVTLLEGMLAHPSDQISELQLLTADERCQWLTEWNDTSKSFIHDRCVHALFEQQVERTPDNTAVICDGGSLSYRELNNRANQLANRLRTLGVGPEALVGIFLERSMDMLVAILGVLKAGAGYLPLDTAYPKDRRAFMLEDARVPVLLTQSSVLNEVPEHSGITICLDREWPSIATEPATNPANLSKPDNVAYVIYTSGSTGKPKGCIVTHANVARLFTATDHWFGFGSNDTWTLFHSFAFDFSVWEIWGALLYGGKLVVVPYLVARSPEQFHELLVEHQVTVLNQTPSAFRQLIVADQQSLQSGKLALRYIVFGGEALEFKTLLPWIERHGDRPSLINMYGITETTVHVTYHKIDVTKIDGNTQSVVGVPIPDLQVYILDSHRQLVPAGVPGELYVGGAGVARGYLNRPELTRERFIPDPFNLQPGRRLYKTGDLARMTSDGNLHYLGRIDHQVKIRGFRVELGEIEAVLLECPGVKECVVLAREDRSGDKRLVAYFVPNAEATPERKDLAERLKQKLPDYMVPAAYVKVPEFPLNANGKLERRALPAPDSADLAPLVDYAPPTDAYEKMLCTIWAEVLGCDRVGIHDNFFELGGHSLLAVRALGRILEKWPYHKLTIAIFLDCPTVAEFAEVIRSGKQVKTQCLVTFREHGSKYPLYWVPGGGGNVVSFQTFSRGFSADQPLYCIQAKGLDGSEPLRSVEEHAHYYIAELRKVQPSGPYHVAGMCFGGLVAFEMARLLRAAGKEVGLLALVDSFNPVYPSTLSKRQLYYAHLSYYLRRLLFHVQAVRKMQPGGRLKYLKDKTASLPKYMGELAAVALGRSRRKVPLPVVNELGAEYHAFLTDTLCRVAQASVLAANQYVPKYYDGKVLVFRASEQPLNVYLDEAMGWRSFAKTVEVVELQGTHELCLDGPGRSVAVRRIEEATSKKASGIAYSHF